MLLIVIERFKTPGGVEVYRRARDRGRMLPEGVRYVSSWVDLDFICCYQVMECSDASELEPWMVEWRDLVDFEVIPVRTSRDAAELIALQL